MPATGTVNGEFFERYIAGRLGADRADVQVGPRHGVDFGVVGVGDRALAVATDPLSVLPALGFERAGRFAVRFVLADVAVSGLAPAHIAVSLALPPGLTDEAFDRLWQGIHAECRALGVSVTTGHTARYPDSTFPWLGAGTAIGIGDPAGLVVPDGARPGDALVVTKGPAVETTGLLTSVFPDGVGLPAETLAVAQERLDDTGVVRDALVAAAAGDVTAMHDATEGGLLGALFEMSDGAGSRFVVDSGAVPVLPGVRATCEALGIDPWRATTGGTLVLTVAPGDADTVVAALEEQGTPAAVVGVVESGKGVVLDGDPQERPEGDASWAAYERLSGE